MPLSGFFSGLAGLMRPMEWSKSFGNMVIAAITAAVAFPQIVQLDLVKFIIGFAAVALLWSGLYALNDYTDRKADAMHPIKRGRAIPSGRVPAEIALLFAIAIVAISLGIGFFLNGSFLFFLCLAIMLVNQVLYTMKPFNFKKRPVLDLISGSLVNPAFRFYAGWTLFVPAFNAPILVLVFVLGIQFGAYGLYRMNSKEHEKCLNYKSSVVCFGERRIRWICYIGILLSGLSFVFLCINSFFWPWLPELRILGFWPKRFLIIGLLSLLALPFYKPAMKKPQEVGKAEIQRLYRVLYFHYIFFILGLAVLYILPQLKLW